MEEHEQVVGTPGVHQSLDMEGVRLTKSPVRKSLPIERTNTGTTASSSSTAAHPHPPSIKTRSTSHSSKTSHTSSSSHSLPALIVLIERCDWNAAEKRARTHPEEAKIWADIRSRSSSSNNNNNRSDGEPSKRLALHHACLKLRSAPTESRKGGGRHGSCGSIRRSRRDALSCIRQIVAVYPEAASKRETRHGCLPLHFAAFSLVPTVTLVKNVNVMKTKSCPAKPGVRDCDRTHSPPRVSPPRLSPTADGQIEGELRYVTINDGPESETTHTAHRNLPEGGVGHGQGQGQGPSCSVGGESVGGISDVVKQENTSSPPSGSSMDVRDSRGRGLVPRVPSKRGSGLVRPVSIRDRIKSDGDVVTPSSSAESESIATPHIHTSNNPHQSDNNTPQQSHSPTQTHTVTTIPTFEAELEDLAAIQIIQTLISTYPRAVRSDSEGGRLPLHMACSGRAAPGIIRALLLANPGAARHRNKDGALPLHLVAYWGCSSEQVAELLLLCYSDAALGKNRFERIPLEEALFVAGENGREVQDRLVRVLRKHPTFWTRVGAKSIEEYRVRHLGGEEYTEEESLSLRNSGQQHTSGHRRNLSDPAAVSLVAFEEEPPRSTLASTDDSHSDNELDDVPYPHPTPSHRATATAVHTPAEIYNADLALLINHRDWNGVHHRITKYPLEAGEWLTVKSRSGRTTRFSALHYACESTPSCPPTVVSTLLHAKRDCLAWVSSPGGHLPLHLACTWGANPNICGMLLECHPDAARVRDEIGNLCLHSACYAGAHVGVLRDLLEVYPKSVLVSNGQGSKPMDIVKRLRHSNKVEALECLQGYLDRHLASVMKSSACTEGCGLEQDDGDDGNLLDDERRGNSAILHDEDAYLDTNEDLPGADKRVVCVLPANINIHQSTHLPENRQVPQFTAEESNHEAELRVPHESHPGNQTTKHNRTDQPSAGAPPNANPNPNPLPIDQPEATPKPTKSNKKKFFSRFKKDDKNSNQGVWV